MNKNKLFLLIIVAAICGGSIPPFAKIGLEAFGPFTLVAIRFFFAAIVLLPFVYRAKQLNRTSFRQVWLAGLISALNPILVFIGLHYTRASLSVLLYAAIPAMTAIYYARTRHQKVSSRQAVGIIIGFLGVALIALLPLAETGQLRWAELGGNALTLAAVVAFFIYTVMSKRLQEKYNTPPIMLTFTFAISSLILSLPFAIGELINRNPSLAQIGPQHVLAGAEVGIIGTALGYLAYQSALKLGSEITAALFTYLQPVSAIILAVILLGESLSWPFVVGGLMALLGAQLASNSVQTTAAQPAPISE